MSVADCRAVVCEKNNHPCINWYQSKAVRNGTSIKLREHVQKVEAFVGMTDERWNDLELVDLLSQIHGFKWEFEDFRSQLGLYCEDIED